MDIRTRLSLILVAVSLISMALLGTFAYVKSASLLQEISLRQLDALAESKKRDLNKVYESWEDKLRLVRSLESLRVSVRDHVLNGNVEARRSLESIIQGIILSLPKIDQLIVYDLDGKEFHGSPVWRTADPGHPPGEPREVSVELFGTHGYKIWRFIVSLGARGGGLWRPADRTSPPKLATPTKPTANG